MTKPFIPPQLPPKIDYTPLISDISSCRDAVARLDEAIDNLPNPNIIQHSFQTKEAVLSSKIEGTQLTLKEALAFDAKEEEQEETEQQKDYREIINYRYTLQKGKELLENKPLTENLIKELHAILLDSVRGHNRRPGEFRNQQVIIGPPGVAKEDASYIPPPPQEIKELFKDLEQYINNDEAPDPLVQIALIHYQFEAIHPFTDGNGRVGRILIPLFLHKKDVTQRPIIFVSEYMEKYRSEYYEALANVSKNNAWEEWIRFFLEAIQQQSKSTSEKVQKADSLYKKLVEQIPDFNSIYAQTFIDALFHVPVFSPLQIKKYSSITNNQTLYSLVDKFEEAGVIKEVKRGSKRRRLFIFEDLYRVIR